MFDNILGSDEDDETNGDETSDDADASPDNPGEYETEDAEYTEEDLQEEPADGIEVNWEPPEQSEITELVNLHQDFLAPSELKAEETMIRSGKQWVRNYYVNEWPNTAQPGFLEGLFSDAQWDTDATIHLEPRSRSNAMRSLKRNMGDIRAEYQQTKDKDPARTRDLEKNLQDAEQMYDLVSQQGMTMFNASMYVNFRATSPAEITDYGASFRPIMEEPPADTDLKISKRVQDRGMLAASPVGKDAMGKKKPMPAGAAASMMPFSSTTMIEQDGIDYGIQRHNQSPVIVDRFSRDTGYNMATIGDIGSGKSFSTKLQILRTLMRRKDVEVVMLDPLNGFEGLASALDANRVTVGGSEGLNPLEIRETPDFVLDAMDEKAREQHDPYSSKLKDVMAFFDTFFEMQGIEIGAERGILQDAIQQAYDSKGITAELDTHSRESPTIQDVLSYLAEMAENPTKYTRSSAPQEREQRSDYASELLVALAAFEEGNAYENLSKHTEINPTDGRVTYIDLSSQESSDSGRGLMMQLLFSMVYERAKQTDNKTLFVIDEAHFLMNDTANLEFMEQAVRHSRHYDMSIHFITQKLGDFYGNSSAEAILENCSMKQLCQLSDLNEQYAMEKLGLNKAQVNFVKNAQPGDEDLDYSEALLEVGNEGWYPIRIQAQDDEFAICDFDARDDDRVDLPGYGDGGQDNIDQMQDILADRINKSRNERQQGREDHQRDRRIESFLVDEDFRSLDLDELGANRSQVYAGDSFESESGTHVDDGDPDMDADIYTLDPGADEGTHMYHVRLKIHEDAIVDDGEIPVLEGLSNAFEVFSTDPTKIALKAGNYDGEFDTLIGTPIAPDTLAHAFAGVDQVDSVAVTDVSRTVDWASDDVEATPNDQLKDASSSNNEEVSEEFERMKEEEDLKSMDVDEDGFESFN